MVVSDNSKPRNLKLVMAEGILANFTLGFLFIWTVMRNPFLKMFPTWTEGMLSLIFGLHNLFICVGIIAGGKLAVKFSGRFVFKLFVILSVIGLCGFAFLPENNSTVAYIMAFILFCIFAATGMGFGLSAVQSHTIPWFPEKSGMISGLCYMMLGLSSVILSLLSGIILPVLGPKMTMCVFGLIVLVVGVVILFDKQSITLPKVEKKYVSNEELTGFTPREILKSPMFWFFLIWNLGTRASGLIMLDHVASLSVAYGGITIVGMLISPCNGLGCITLGTTLDKIGTKKVMFITSLVMLFGGGLLVTGHFMNCFPVILVGILLVGFAYGGSNSTYPASIQNHFGLKHYSENFGLANLSIGIASLIESFSGNILDSFNGNYLSIMIMMISVTIPSLLCAALYFVYSKKKGIKNN